MTWEYFVFLGIWMVAVLVAFYIAVRVYVWFYLKWRNWRYPDYDRELIAMEQGYIDNAKTVLVKSIGGDNFKGRRHWALATVFYLVLIGAFIGSMVLAIYLLELSSSKPQSSHPEFGTFIGKDTEDATIWVQVFSGIFGWISLVVAIVYLGFFRTSKFTNWFIISQRNHNGNLKEKAESRAEGIEHFYRLGIIDNQEPFDLDRFSFLVTRVHALAFLKAGIILLTIAAIASWLGSNLSTKFYQTGLVTGSMPSTNPSQISYADFDRIGISCLYNEEEHEYTQRGLSFILNDDRQFELLIDFDKVDLYVELDNHLRGLGKEFFNMKYSFKYQKNVENPFLYCVSKMIDENRKHRQQIIQIMHFRELSGKTE